MKDLSQRNLSQLKETVTKNLSATIEAGLALKEIKDRELWKEEAESFQAFCVDNWGVSRSRAYQLIECAEIVTELPPQLSTMVDTERGARELKKVPKEKRAEVVEQAANNGRATATAIENAAAAASNIPEQYDRTGFEIPQPSPASITWLRADEIQSMLTALSRIKVMVERGCGNADPKDNDLMLSEINASALVADLMSSYQQLKVALPFAVCPTCQGRVLSPCSTCGGRGMVSEFYWKHKVPEEVREIRKRAVAMKNQ